MPAGPSHATIPGDDRRQSHPGMGPGAAAPVVTNLRDASVAEVMVHYHGLWQVEESFRITKHDLKMRPIWNWNENRIRAHIAIAFMAFACVRHLAYRVAIQKRRLTDGGRATSMRGKLKKAGWDDGFLLKLLRSAATLATTVENDKSQTR